MFCTKIGLKNAANGSTHSTLSISIEELLKSNFKIFNKNFHFSIFSFNLLFSIFSFLFNILANIKIFLKHYNETPFG